MTPNKPGKYYCTTKMQIITTFAIILVLAIFTIQTTEAARSGNNKGPVVLDEDNWSQLLHGEWMVDLFAPWCPACKKLEPEWRKFADWSDDLNIQVATADVTINPGLSGRFMVRGLPTIYHVKDGIFRLYSGPREHTALINFIEENGWKKIEPVSRWIAPDTLQMSFLAYSFRISMALRDIHNHLVDNVGLPYYISYLIFALCTVAVGTTLGLLLVFVVDQFCPPRYPEAAQESRSNVASRKKTDKSNDSDLDDTEEVKETSAPKAQSSETLRKRTKG